MSFDAQRREASVAVNLHRQALVDDVVAHLAVCRSDAPRERRTDFVDRCSRDVGYHFDYLREALAASDPSLFVHYASWVRTLLAGLGLPADATIDTLRAMRDAIRTDLAGAPGEIAASFVTVALRHVESSHDQPPSYLVHDTPLGQLGQEYLARLLHHSALHPKIMVGGYPFNVSPDLWQKVNADGFAPSADEAVKVGLQLVA